MKLAIVGSIALAGNQEALAVIERVLDQYQPDQVISGGAKGIDTMAKEAAARRGILVIEYLPRHRRWAGEGGFMERNQIIAETCDRLVRIAAKGVRTYGSGWTRDRTKYLGKPTEEYVIATKPTPMTRGAEG